jgi:glycosyltransferase involved in cell wall biosynthesis
MRTILHTIETGGTGGAETVYLDLVRRLDPTRWRHVAIVPTREWMYDQLTALGIETVVMPERKVIDGVLSFVRAAALIKTHDVDLIHAHLFGSAVRASVLARVCGVPAIATLHGAIDFTKGQRFRGAKVAAISHGLNRVVFVSEALRRSFIAQSKMRPELATVITNGIDASKFSSADGASFRAELGIGAKEFVVGTVATPGRRAKGLDILLEAASILKELSPDCKIVIIGDLDLGRGDALLKDRKERGLTNDVIVTGFRKDVNRALASFDLYAMASRSEGFPLSLLEAMAAGLPIVATRCGGPEQILEDGVTGVLVPNESPADIAAAIASLRQRADERKRLGERARAAARTRFTLDAQVRAYDALYESCLSEHWSRSQATTTEALARDQA